MRTNTWSKQIPQRWADSPDSTDSDKYRYTDTNTETSYRYRYSYIYIHIAIGREEELLGRAWLKCDNTLIKYFVTHQHERAAQRCIEQENRIQSQQWDQTDRPRTPWWALKTPTTIGAFEVEALLLLRWHFFRAWTILMGARTARTNEPQEPQTICMIEGTIVQPQQLSVGPHTYGPSKKEQDIFAQSSLFHSFVMWHCKNAAVSLALVRSPTHSPSISLSLAQSLVGIRVGVNGSLTLGDRRPFVFCGHCQFSLSLQLSLSLSCLLSLIYLSLFWFLQIIEPVCICFGVLSGFEPLRHNCCRIVWPSQIFGK